MTILNALEGVYVQAFEKVILSQMQFVNYMNQTRQPIKKFYPSKDFMKIFGAKKIIPPFVERITQSVPNLKT